MAEMSPLTETSVSPAVDAVWVAVAESDVQPPEDLGEEELREAALEIHDTEAAVVVAVVHWLVEFSPGAFDSSMGPGSDQCQSVPGRTWERVR